MVARAGDPVHYALTLGDDSIPLADYLGQRICIHFEGVIRCIACDRVTRRSYAQGYCYPCSRRLAACDLCILRPERCHHAQGTCREPDWGLAHCMQPHVVYLADTSGAKVGITRATQMPVRWLDQGALQALPILGAASRHAAGLAEVCLAAHVSDRTDWRRMLAAHSPAADLPALRDSLLARCEGELRAVGEELGANALEVLRDTAVQGFRYPLDTPPPRLDALDLGKTSRVEGTLLGIKAQYLVLDTGVLNVRRHTGYVVEVST